MSFINEFRELISSKDLKICCGDAATVIWCEEDGEMISIQKTKQEVGITILTFKDINLETFIELTELMGQNA